MILLSFSLQNSNRQRQDTYIIYILRIEALNIIIMACISFENCGQEIHQLNKRG